MSKLFSWLKPTGNPPVNGYDLSKRETFSFTPGMLHVAYQRLVVPKSHVNMKLGAIINSMPMVNQNFSRGQFVCDVYQVPLNQLWDKFNDFYAQNQELFSSADNSSLETSCANVNLMCVYAIVLHDLIHLVGYAAVEGAKFGDAINAFLVNPMEYVTDESVPDLTLGLDVHGIPVVFGALRLLDMCGYGNLLLLVRSWATFVGTNRSIVPATDKYGSSDWLDDDVALASVIVYDMIFRPMYDLPYSKEGDNSFGDYISEQAEAAWYSANYHEALVNLRDSSVPKSANFPDNLPLVSAWPLLAYQKIFNDIYRNTFYDESNVCSFNIDLAFNRQDIIECDVNEPDIKNDVRGQFIVGMLTPRYRQFKNDMFTCLLPNSQMGEVAMVSTGDSAYSIAREFDDDQYQDGDPLTLEGNAIGIDGNDSKWKLSPTPAFSVLVQRRAEALQKYKERYLRAGNRLKDQFISTFGKVPYYLEDKYVRYLGSLTGSLSLQGVPATNDTGNYNVGERASYGVGAIQDSLDFAVDDFSIIMAVVYYLPELDYESFNLDPAHTYSEPFDFPVPEFENIGLAPLYRNALSMAATYFFDETEQSFVEMLGNRVVGYGPAYLPFKTDVDRLHGEFGCYQINHNKINGIFSSWVTSRGNVSMSDLGDYYVRPDFLNSLMVSQYNGWSGQDPFVSVFNWDVKISQPLTVVGLPIWN